MSTKKKQVSRPENQSEELDSLILTQQQELQKWTQTLADRKGDLPIVMKYVRERYENLAFLSYARSGSADEARQYLLQAVRIAAEHLKTPVTSSDSYTEIQVEVRDGRPVISRETQRNLGSSTEYDEGLYEYVLQEALVTGDEADEMRSAWKTRKTDYWEDIYWYENKKDRSMSRLEEHPYYSLAVRDATMLKVCLEKLLQIHAVAASKGLKTGVIQYKYRNLSFCLRGLTLMVLARRRGMALEFSSPFLPVGILG